jgi:3-phenylpropionate/cinnamic acid dioxygenase small subunit
MTDTAAEIESIRRTLALYCQLCDDGRFDEWAQLFTDDAEFSVLGNTHVGRADVQAFIESAQPPELRGKHVCANSLIEIDERGGTATALTDYVFVGRTPEGMAVTSAGRYHDSFIRDGERWLFRRREIAFMGGEP